MSAVPAPAPPGHGLFKAHPVADLFPLLKVEDPRYKEMRLSIQTKGQLSPIIMSGDVVLDGRNRRAICDDLELEPWVVQFSTLEFNVSEAEYALEANLRRRDLTGDQRVAIFAAFEAFKPRPTGRPAAATKGAPADTLPGKTRAKLAEKADVSTRKAAQVLRVQKADPALAKDVALGNVTLAEADKTITPPPPASAPLIRLLPKGITSINLPELPGCLLLLADFSHPLAMIDSSRVRKAASALRERAACIHGTIINAVEMLEELKSSTSPPRFAHVATILRQDLAPIAAELAECNLSWPKP